MGAFTFRYFLVCAMLFFRVLASTIATITTITTFIIKSSIL